ncbi:MAG: hypothetical protein M3177_00975, partial [Pseudomonadota bacterium]|nr:hypothetical protein [Pseudomonadota bacterium]
MLRHDGRGFRKLSTADAEWLRAELLALLATREVPEEALPILLEEIETSSNPHVLAGAARALRSLGVPSTEFEEPLKAAAKRLLSDEYVAFAVDAPTRPRRTAREELHAVVRSLPTADRCCHSGVATRRAPSGPLVALAPDSLAKAEVQDQEGRCASLGALTHGPATLLALFYTRCMNPLKCSATIAGLAR